MRFGWSRVAETSAGRLLPKEHFGGDGDGEKQHERDAEDAEEGKHVRELHLQERFGESDLAYRCNSEAKQHGSRAKNRLHFNHRPDRKHRCRGEQAGLYRGDGRGAEPRAPDWQGPATTLAGSSGARQGVVRPRAGDQPGRDRRRVSSDTGQVAARPSSSRVRRWPTVCQGVTSRSSGMISRI